jgi:uncharacterized membrane protein YhhN
MPKKIENLSNLLVKRNTLIIFTAVYFIIGAIYIYPPSWINGICQPVLKAAPILLLAVWALSSRVKYGWLIGVGLIFSAAGDITLDVHSLGFLFGMCLFAMAHIIYIICFTVSIRFNPARFISAFVFICCIAILIWRLSQSSGLSDPLLRWMVYTYTMIITLMVVTAFFYNTYSIIIPAGAVIFAISDSMIAWNRFILPIQNSGILIMSTYYMAQYMIMFGYLKSANCVTHNSLLNQE